MGRMHVNESTGERFSKPAGRYRGPETRAPTASSNLWSAYAREAVKPTRMAGQAKE